MSILTRRHWGAAFGVGSPAPKGLVLVVIHHFASPDVAPDATRGEEAATMRAVERTHGTPRSEGGNGWAGIGYNFVVMPSGRAYEGRGWGRVGAHTAGMNDKSVGIACGWNGEVRGLTPAAIAAVREILEEGVLGGYLAPVFAIRGHLDYSATACPGRLIYPRLEQLRPLRFGEVETEPEEERPPRVGDRRWSEYLGEHIILTRYDGPEEWRFVRESHLKLIGAKGTVPWSSMPPERPA